MAHRLTWQLQQEFTGLHTFFISILKEVLLLSLSTSPPIARIMPSDDDFFPEDEEAANQSDQEFVQGSSTGSQFTHGSAASSGVNSSHNRNPTGKNQYNCRKFFKKALLCIF